MPGQSQKPPPSINKIHKKQNTQKKPILKKQKTKKYTNKNKKKNNPIPWIRQTRLNKKKWNQQKNHFSFFFSFEVWFYFILGEKYKKLFSSPLYNPLQLEYRLMFQLCLENQTIQGEPWMTCQYLLSFGDLCWSQFWLEL